MNLKKILAFVLSLAMLISLLPAGAITAFAAEDATVAETNAAKIGDTEYATLADAVKAVPQGTTATPTTITLLKSHSISSLMIGHQYAQNIIVDLNGFTLSSNAIVLTSYRGGTTLTVQNGTISGNSTSGTLRATYGGKIVLGENLTVKGAGGSATLVYVDNGSVEVGAKSGVAFTGGKIDFKKSDNANNKINVAASIGRTYFGSLATAFAAAKDGDTIKLFDNIALDTMIVNEKVVTLDLNGKTVTGTDTTSKNFSLIDNRGTLTITGEGTMTLTAEVNSGWNRYSAVIANNPGGKLTVENGTIQHLGGTDMAYGIDNLTNGKGTYAETVINGGLIKSTYRGIRQFLNGVEAQNILTINGGTVEGENKSVWVQSPNAKANTGKITVAEGAALNGDVYLFATAGATELPISVSIAASAVNGKVTTANFPAGFVLENDGTTYGVNYYEAAIGTTNYKTVEEAFAEVEAEETITLLAPVKVENILEIKNSIVLDGNDMTLTSTAGRAINVATEGNVTIKNLKINCSGERAINVITKPATLTIENVDATAANYTVNVAKSAGAAKLTINGGIFNGLNVVNVAGAKAEVTITGATINCNDNNPTAGEAYAALCLNKDAVEAKITANGCTINVTEGSDSDVARIGAYKGVITLDSEAKVKTDVAAITYEGNNYYYGYETLDAAIEAAKDGDTITLVNNINLTAEDLGEKYGGYNTFFNISGKTVTLDLNGCNITADVKDATLDAFILGVFTTTNDGDLILKDSKGTGSVKGVSGTQEQAYLDASKGNKDYNYKFYSLLVNYDDDSTITVDGGNYELDYAGDSLAYTSSNEGIVINGGTFKVGNLGGIRNGMPWVFNARGQNIRHVVVNGGSFCADIQHQYYPFEVQIAKELALKNENGMYTVVPAVAYVTEREWSSAWYTNEIGYATLEEALAACEGPKTKANKTSEQEEIVLLKDVTLAENSTIVINKPVVIDLNGKTIYGENTRTSTHNFLIDVKGGTLTAKNGTIAMKHTGTNMGWNGATTVIDVTAGGVLNLEDVTVQNQGGTDMNFAVHLNNWGKVTLNADNCVFDAPYCGVRVFNSGYDMNNVKITNSKLTGGNRAFWVHNYLGDLDSSKHSDEAIKARLNLDIYGNNNTFELSKEAKAPIRYGFGETVYFNADGTQVV